MMTDRQHDDAIAEEAAHWVARLSSRDATGEDRRRFDQWCLQSPENAAAFEEMNALWGDLAHVPRTVAARRSLVSRRHVAALFIVGCLGFAIQASSLPDRLRADFYTPVGSVQQVTLDDGSVVTLNTDSAIKVDFDTNVRRIVLLRGEAFFDVVANPSRPFVVDGGRVEATALGTHYAVRVDGAEEQVIVEEGRVAVNSGDQSAVLAAGGVARLDGEGTLTTTEGDVADMVNWRSGKLVFSGRPLGDVLAEIGRYRRGRIIVLDDAVARIRVSGVFDVHDTDQAFEALEKSLPINVIRATGWVTFVRSR